MPADNDAACENDALVDVLVVNYLTGDLTRQAVSAVTGPDVCVRVYDNSGELLAEPAGLAVSGDGTNTYFAAANNALFDGGSAPYVLLLNPDVVLSHADLRRLVAVLAANSQAWGVAPRLVWPDGSPQRYVRRLPTAAALAADRLPPLRLLLGRAFARYRCFDVDLDKTQRVEQPPAAALLLRRAAAGPCLFDESFRLFFNDVDLCRRLNAVGHCIYVAEVSASHEGGASIRRARAASDSVSREYDEALLAYARRYVRGGRLLGVVVAVRRPLLSLLARFGVAAW